MQANRWITAGMIGVLALGSGPASAAPARPLDRRQTEAVQRADAQCTEVGKTLAQIEKTRETIEKADPSTITDETIRDLKDQIKSASNSLNTVERSIRYLPADNADVKTRTDKIASQRATLASASESIEAFNKRLSGVLAVGNGPDAQKDIEWVKTMTTAYAPFQLAADPKRAAELAARVQDDVKTLAALLQKFKPLMQKGTAEGKEFKYWVEQAESHVGQFRYKCQMYVDKGADIIPQAFAKAIKSAEEAAAARKPAFFTGGVADQLEQARRNVDAYAAAVGAKDPKTEKLRAQLAETEKKIESLRSTLRQEILASTKCPPDAYKGADKAQLKGLVEEQWKAEYPKDELLAVRFVTPEWNRKNGASWSAAWKSWENYDRSEMQVRVIVKTDDKLATVYWVYINKDHMSKDLIKIEARTKGGGSDEMLMANVEQ